MKNEIETIQNNGNGKESRKKLMVLALAGFIMAGVLSIFYVYLSQNRIYVETAYVEAPAIALSSKNGGVLQELFVKVGDRISENQVVAQVGQELVKTKEAGIVTKADSNIGKNYLPGEMVVTMIQPNDLKIVARAEENKGLSEIKAGQKVFFTVDAFDSKKFQGIVDEVSPTSRDADVVFNISDQREAKEFNVKIRFDISQYPELKNGMSAKTWIYKN
jgi:multidrug resistance efflux pump